MSTALALTEDPEYDKTEILLLDKWPVLSSESQIFVPNPTATSTDTSRIVRSDYTGGLQVYAPLAVEAQKRWREEWGANGRYSESGYILIANDGDTDEMPTGGFNHVTLAYENAVRAAGGNSRIELLDTEVDIERVSGYPITKRTDKDTHSWKGYVNRASGWADAAASMQYLGSLVLATNRVKFLKGEAQKLLYSPSSKSQNNLHESYRTVQGVLLNSGQRIFADQTILAAGPYTSSLTDLRAGSEARGQVSAYVKLTPQERVHFPAGGNPCMMDASSGSFVIGPDREDYIKITCDNKGYRNPVRLWVASDGHPDLPGVEGKAGNDEREKEIETSLPWHRDGPDLSHLVPLEAERSCRAYLHRLFPPSSPSPFSDLSSRPFDRFRVCCYTDTRTANFIISYHPRYDHGSLFIATGGSGHAFKFLPILGEKIVQVLRSGPGDNSKDEPIAELKSAWKFPEPRKIGDDGIVFCEDGSRHGRPDMVFEECLRDHIHDLDASSHEEDASEAHSRRSLGT